MVVVNGKESPFSRGPRLQIKNRLKEYRTAKGISQAKLAVALGVKEQNIEMYDVNKMQPSDKMAKALCEFFECTVSDMFYFEE